MAIGVLLKQVPDTTAKIGVTEGRVDETAVSKWSMSPYDEYALESALRLKEAEGGDVVAITCGPTRAAKMLTDAAAVGADSLLHVLVDNLGALDSTQIQSILVAALRQADCDVVFCGKQAADTNAGSTGPGVALLLGASCVSHVSEVSPDEGGFLALRASTGGDERVQVSTPCIFAFDKGSEELRRPNVRGIMMAKKKAVETMSPSDLGVPLDNSRVTVVSHTPPAEKPPGQKFEGAESVATVVSKLRDEANVI